jgi:hypothetical protein
MNHNGVVPLRDVAPRADNGKGPYAVEQRGLETAAQTFPSEAVTAGCVLLGSYRLDMAYKMVGEWEAEEGEEDVPFDTGDAVGQLDALEEFFAPEDDVRKVALRTADGGAELLPLASLPVVSLQF